MKQRSATMNMICRSKTTPVFGNVEGLKISALALLLVVSAGSPVKAEIYKWKDKDGVQHYSEQPPAGSKYEQVKPSYAPAPAPAPATTAQGSQDKVASERTQQEQRHKEEAAKIRQQNCTTVQQRLSDLESASRITFREPDGTTKLLSEDERQAKITETKGLIKQYCDLD